MQKLELTWIGKVKCINIEIRGVQNASRDVQDYICFYKFVADCFI